MRSIFILLPLFFHFVLFTHAVQNEEYAESKPVELPESVIEGISGGTHKNGYVPGPPSKGQDPSPAPEDDDNINFNDIVQKLNKLIVKILDDVGKSRRSTATTTPTATITPGPLPTEARPCAYALKAYSSCSTAYTGTISASAAIVRADCLCNPERHFDFNGEMESCYSYAQNQTQYQSYASIIASATAVCSGVSNGNAGGYTSTASPATTTSSSSSAAAATSSLQVNSEARVSPSPTGAARSLNACLSIVVTVAALAFMCILY